MIKKLLLTGLAALALCSGCSCPDIPANLSKLTDSTASPLFYGPFSIFMWILILAIYFMPTIIAFITRKSRMVTVLLINAFLGWTVVGWIIAFVLARI